MSRSFWLLSRRPTPKLLLAAALALATLTSCLQLQIVGSTSSSSAVQAAPARINFSTFQAADVVTGQPDFISNASGLTSNTLNSPAHATLLGSVFYIADTENNRILGFNSIPSQNNVGADFVLGQPDFTSNSSGVSSTTFSQPEDIKTFNGKFFVMDVENNRLLIWNSTPADNSVPADVVIGQNDFTSNGSPCTQNGLSNPEQFFIVHDQNSNQDKLILPDEGHNRVLIWNSIPTTNGANADVVLGQPDFTTCAAGTSSTELREPDGVWSDGQRLIVTDLSNNRVLVWNQIPTSNQAPADIVLGQADMNSSGSGASTMNAPYAIASNGSQLFIADCGNNRVLIWNQLPTESSVMPDVVLGQSDFSHSASNDDNQDGVDDGHPSARTMNCPTSLYLDSTRLIVADDTNNRVLIFNGQ